LEFDAHLRMQHSQHCGGSPRSGRGARRVHHAACAGAMERTGARSLEQISKASFVGTIYLVLLVMAALAFAGASFAVLMIE
jgi:hypothetical protein